MGMDRKIVISQSMLFPWVGMLEQIKQADIFVHYDDVQYSKGSFVNRVQLKLPEGWRWMTVPLQAYQFGQSINQVKISVTKDWRKQHLDLLKKSLASAPFYKDAIGLVEAVYENKYDSIGELSRTSLLALANYFNLSENCRFLDVGDLDIAGRGTDRVLSVVKKLKGNIYVTGHGALNYLDHHKFDQAGVSVQYMKYRYLNYPQQYGEFNPYVSALDLVANCGSAGAQYIQSKTIDKESF